MASIVPSATLPAAAGARRPLLPPRAALGAFLVALGGAVLSIELVAICALGAYVAPSLHIAVFFVAYDLATGAVLLWAARRRLARDLAAANEHAGSRCIDSTPSVAVLIAAYNEASDGADHGIVATVRGIAAQAGVAFEVLVGDDGSEDGTHDAVVRAFGLRPTTDGFVGEVCRSHEPPVTVRAFRFSHAGKGATLNALASRARREVFVTVDADTVPAPGALSRLASAFIDPRVDSAAGVVSVRNAQSVLVTYRLVDYGLALRRVPIVVTVPRAQAFTDVPVKYRGFVRQRTRWFAGFLSTLFRFRHLIGRTGAGGFGIVRLPLKLVDAVLPLLAFGSLAVLVRGAVSPVRALSRVAIGIFLVRWAWDLIFYGAALQLSRHLGDPDATRRVAPARWQGWLCTATEALTYIWLKHAAVLRAYGWAARRVKTWEASRESAFGR
ncbi:MAG: glycosyltransferase family 2 protein [Polyangiaceae bacterium]